MALHKSNRLLAKGFKCFLAAETSSRRTFSTRLNPSNKQLPKYLAILTFGAASYYLYDKFRNPSSASLEKSLNLDLNEMYEKPAVVFLSNPELRDALGMPVKITTNNSISDEVRSLNLRREGSDLYAFIAYYVQGSQNSGVVYCKLKMDKSTEKFKTESILLKLNKPDSKKRTEIVIKSTVTKPQESSK